LGELCILDVVDDDGRLQRLDVVFADPGHESGAIQLRAIAPTQMGLESGRAQLVPELTPASIVHDRAHAELLCAIGGQSAMVLPMVARGRTLGVLTLVSTSGRRFDAEDLQLGDDVACRAALAIDNARLYEQAQRAIRARQDLLATVSHDLKNPLSNILMGTEALKRIMRRVDPTAFRRLESIWRAADRMDRMILDLLDLANIDAQKLAVATRRESVAALLHDALEPFEEPAERSRLRLRCGPTADGLEIECDRGRMLQVLGNLVGNAIKFTPAGGTVAVRTERRGNDVLFSVSDTGPGIDPDDVDHIFDRYWQARKTAQLGTGLGLSIVKGLVEAHGGRIWAESALGRGAAFFFTIPCADPH
jgi:signal transduction histidine kinase